MTFKELNLSAPLLRAVQEAGYETPSPIQAAAIPPVLAGRDLMGCAQTGTGKTAAFALPMLDRLTATDVLDGDISSGIRITSQNVINSQPGVYSVTAQVDSRLGNSVVLPLKVVITAGGPQLITLSDYLVYLPRGSAFDAAGYIQSVTAPDGTALSAGQVSIESPVDTSVPGTYHVGYSVTAQGQSYTVYLAVVVE